MRQYGSGPARPARVYTKGLCCFQPKGSPTAWITDRAKVSHYDPGQDQSKRLCQSRPHRWHSRSPELIVSFPPGHGVRCAALLCPGCCPYCWYEIVKVRERNSPYTPLLDKPRGKTELLLKSFLKKFAARQARPSVKRSASNSDCLSSCVRFRWSGDLLWPYCSSAELLFLERNQHIPVLITNTLAARQT